MSFTPINQQYPARLANALQAQGVQSLRTQKRKADDDSSSPRPTKSTVTSHDYSNLQLEAPQSASYDAGRYDAAARVATDLLRAGHSKSVAMKVFDQVYQTGGYDKTLIGYPEARPSYDFNHPMSLYLDRNAIDQVWSYKLKWGNSFDAIEPVSPKGKSGFQ